MWGLLFSLIVCSGAHAFVTAASPAIHPRSPRSPRHASNSFSPLQSRLQVIRGGDSIDGTIGSALRGGADASQPDDLLPATVPPLPTFKNFYKFAIPCLGLWVSGPLLSLVDTAFVGLSSAGSESAKQLAALGPATTFFDGATYLFAFLNVATTNLYGSARAQAGEDSERAESVVRSAAKVALNCGFGIMFFLFAFCRPLLALYIGT